MSSLSVAANGTKPPGAVPYWSGPAVRRASDRLCLVLCKVFP
jgi:hypothetical protein